MAKHSRYRPLMDIWKKVSRIFKKEPPEDPYAYVGAPKKPRPPHRSAAAAEPLD